MRQKGFTLIELLIVVVIVAILAAALIPNILNARTRALQAAAQSYARDVLAALESVQSTFSRLDWQRTVAAGPTLITIATNGTLQTTNNNWRDSFGTPLNPQPSVTWSDYLQSPSNGIETVIVGTNAANDFSNIRICISQRVPGGTTARYNIYSLYPNSNEFRARTNQTSAATAIANCP